MKIVIQCAATKNQSRLDAGFKSSDGRTVKFVGRPELVPSDNRCVYVRPDDLVTEGKTWRELLVQYNINRSNPAHLLPAYLLYKHQAYQHLVNKFGLENVFILSAGWGLISGSFLTPDYDITFSRAKNVLPQNQRSKQDNYNDFCNLPDDGEDILFFGGKDYLPLFIRLTDHLRGEKKVIFNSDTAPSLPTGFSSKRFLTTQRTNWHYSAAQALIDGGIEV
jgi:hypothetical protein